MGRPKLPEILKTCATCGNEFYTSRKHPEKLNCSDECRIKYSLVHTDERIKKAFDAIEKKYGVRSFPQTKGFSDKVKQTKKERYGNENYNNFEKIKQTHKENYGVEYNMQVDGFKEQSKISKKKRYGDENYNNKEQTKKTILDKFGVEHHLQTKECMDKQIATNEEKYGVKYNIKTPEAMKNLIIKNNEYFGSDYYFSSNINLNRQIEIKFNSLKPFLEENDLEFNFDDYTKLRVKQNDGKYENLYYEITCKLCNNTFESSFLSGMMPVCRKCYPVSRNPKQQVELRDFLTQLNINFHENNRKLIKPYEVDFNLPDLNFAIELNGNYFHAEIGRGKTKEYHLMKTQMCHNTGTKLIQIFEDEWLNKKHIIKYQIESIINPDKFNNNIINSVILPIDFNTRKEFLEENDIQGNDNSFYNIGLYDNQELISIMTFSKLRNKKENNIVLHEGWLYYYTINPISTAIILL